MRPLETILNIINRHPDAISEWGYESPMELTDGLAFGVNSKGYDPGWVQVRYDDGDDSFFLRIVEQEYGFAQEVCMVPEKELFDVLHKLVIGDLSEDEIREMERRWWDEP